MPNHACVYVVLACGLEYFKAKFDGELIKARGVFFQGSKIVVSDEDIYSCR